MNYLHYEFELNADDVVEVTLDKQANVRLLDPANYALYERGAPHRYFGGLAKVSPVQIAVPRPGHWHLVIDLGGFAGTVHADVQLPSDKNGRSAGTRSERCRRGGPPAADL